MGKALLIFCVLTIFGLSQVYAATGKIESNLITYFPTKDSSKILKKRRLDSLLSRHSPRTAAIRSAILPGWGQAYNHQYWKIPIVYGALGATAGVFTYNLTWYKRTRYAYKVAITKDVNNYPNVYSKLQNLLTSPYGSTSLKYYRDSYRRDIDYSALFFIGFWGLNVIDAVVYSHLKQFDISPDLSFRIKPGLSPIAGTAGISAILDIGKRKTPSVTRFRD